MRGYLSFAAALGLLLLSSLSGNVGEALAKTPQSGVKAILGFEMQTYTAPDGSFSLYVPKGWVAEPSEAGITFVQNPSDHLSARIDLFVIALQAPVTSVQFIEAIANQMKASYPTFQIDDALKLSDQPDITAVVFTYQDGGTKVSGFGIAQCNSNVALWTDIYGRDSGFKNYNPTLLLTYVLQSMNQGSTPGRPSLPQPEAVAQADRQASRENKKKMEEAMVMNHYWNMYPHLAPGGIFNPF